MKSYLKNACNDGLIFYSRNGKPDTLFSADLEKAHVNDIKYDYLYNLLLDKKACGGVTSNSQENIQRRSTALAECLIFAGSTKQHHVLPPFHHGLMVELFHDYGSRSLIELLNSFGFCASYHELKLFLTSAATTELERNERFYVPSNIIPRTGGGALIQEEDDNIDLSVNTIDGRNSYHSMGQTLFQKQLLHFETNYQKIPRIQKTSLDSKISGTKFQYLPFNKPKQKCEPPRVNNVVGTIKKELEKKFDLNPKDLLWELARRHCRLKFSENSNEDQIFPSWELFSGLFYSKKESRTVVSSLPAINAKATDMIKGKETAAACGQKYHIHTEDQQLYAIFQMVKFAFPSEFDGCTNRMGGFHTCNVFIDCINKLWGDTLYDMLVESGVYAPNTTAHMLKGKDFHKAFRGLTLCYEVLLTLLLDNFFTWLGKIGKVTELKRILETMIFVKVFEFKERKRIL
ncbi:hypothetical protein QAD02_014020 [Eretmocerus hayati]|uniref:Uncharacterized protein n=1 Tax=Eretmocerus hayati TaxID=131215 RepID=A0ACC2P440_9HYME|nr:hypothetical protein QAD02_014020 [Eretmocerus hayati]